MIKQFIKDCMLFQGDRVNKGLGMIAWLSVAQALLGILSLIHTLNK